MTRQDLDIPEHFSEDPDLDDRILTVPLSDKENCSMDLPPSIASLLATETYGNIQATNNNGRNIANIAMGALQAGVARVHNELGTEESRAISGVMATPIAPPTTGSAGA